MPQLSLDEKLHGSMNDIRRAYKNGKRTYEIDGVKFTIKRCGPENNFLAVGPVKGFAPIINFPYDEAKYDKMMESRRSPNPQGRRR